MQKSLFAVVTKSSFCFVLKRNGSPVAKKTMVLVARVQPMQRMKLNVCYHKENRIVACSKLA